MSFSKTIFTYFKSTLSRVGALIRRYSNKRTGVAFLVVLVFLGFGLAKGVLSKGADTDFVAAQRQVTTVPAGAISQLESVFETTGEVTSQIQGDLRAQRTGIITRVHATVGDTVSAGSIIVSIENASERASVAQAQAGVAQAQASLNKVQGGTRNEQLAVFAASTVNATQTLNESLIASKNVLLNAYAATDAAFVGGVDSMFRDADGANPQLLFVSTNNSQVISAEHSRFLLQAIIDRHSQAATRVTLLDATALRSEINTVEQEIFRIKTSLDNLIAAIDGAVASASISISTISGYKTTANAARSSILATLSTLSSARGALNGAESTLTIAQENESQGVSGAQQEDIDVAQAQLDSAKASLAQAVAQLEDTRVRAPVSGIITILTVDPGDFVSAFQDVGLVANNGALEVVTFVSPAAITRISTGGRARIDSTYEGIVTSISQGIDPLKRQVEVHVALVASDVALTHGSRVVVKFLSSAEEIKSPTTVILIPISALKLIGSDAFVFSVNSVNSLTAHKVELGAVIQESIEIISGINTSTRIVIDARGLNEGDTVLVEN
ncbi:MAG: HlyD family efflux transporter periplasmic adaptor subunit [Candidatus Pacebacteria bacterium]|nr:HlyD family efflux transporter periplasmic adaptor subunit [Candidatus Paceibacterota bacterium]